MDEYIDLLKDLPKDVQVQAKACKTQEEFLELLKTSGLDLSSGPTMLSEEDLDNVAGGDLYNAVSYL